MKFYSFLYFSRQNKKYAFGSACIGGGQGIAVILEKC
jgi:acetyl-CoA acetyltransferase